MIQLLRIKSSTAQSEPVDVRGHIGGSGLPTSLFVSSFSVDGKVTELIGNNGRATLDPLLLRGAYTRVRKLGRYYV
jgi:hypothetical protein